MSEYKQRVLNSLHKVKISRYSHGGTKVEVDGHELHGVTDITLRHRVGDLARLTLEMLAANVDAEVEAEVVNTVSEDDEYLVRTKEDNEKKRGVK